MSERYRTVVADPPWPYEGDGPKASLEHRPRRDQTLGRLGPSSTGRYGSMSIDELKALRIKDHVADGAHLYLWTTNAFMVEAHDVARAWGFEPKTIVTWVKVRHEDGAPSMKTGYYYRGATEHILFAVRGSLRLQGEAHATAFTSPRLPHSRKPEYAYRMIEEQSPGPYLEVFARPLTPLFPKRPGWDTWGNEMDNDVDLEVA